MDPVATHDITILCRTSCEMCVCIYIYGMVYIVAYINNIDEVLAIESNSLII